MPINSLVSLAQSLIQMQRNATALVLYRRDNPGYLYLKEHTPHITAQLDEYTLQWTLLPKAVVFNEQILREMVRIYRSNLENYGLPELPQGVTKEQYLNIVNRLYNFLEAEVAPILSKMPKIEEVKDDATGEFTGDDFDEDAGEDAGEGQPEVADSQESASN